MRCIVDHRDPVPIGDHRDAVDITGATKAVHRQDARDGLVHRLLQANRVDVECVRVNVDKHGIQPRKGQCMAGADKRERRGEHLAAHAAITQGKKQAQRRIGHQHNVWNLQIVGQLALEGLVVFTVIAEHAARPDVFKQRHELVQRRQRRACDEERLVVG